ncbi:unnamed protein product, partial [Meganyctiphanes norvegica]
ELCQLLKSEKVYAAKRTELGIHYGKLIMVNNELCLHVLRDSPPSGHSIILPYLTVRSCADNHEALVFLNLQSGSNPLGRLYIRILGRTPRGDQFICLTTGEMGPSYLNVNFKSPSKKDQPGEWVSSSAYDKKEAAPLFK